MDPTDKTHFSAAFALWDLHRTLYNEYLAQQESDSTSSEEYLGTGSEEDSSDYSSDFGQVSATTSSPYFDDEELKLLHEKVTAPIVSSFKPNTRPFKSYSIVNPFFFANNLRLDISESIAAYALYRQEMLKNEEFAIKSNPNMARNLNTSYVDSDEDDLDSPGRKVKQNHAAKKSRDSRKRKAREMEIRCSFLEAENELLEEELKSLMSANADSKSKSIKNLKF